MSNTIRSLILFLLVAFSPIHSEALSPATIESFERIKKLDYELGHHGGYSGQYLLRLSKMQDEWLIYLHEVEGKEEFNQGVFHLHNSLDSFYSVSSYVSDVVNLYNPGKERIYFPHEDEIGYLNTFKTGRELTSEERKVYFDEEMHNYLRDGLVEPFTLDEKSLYELKPGVIYNFGLFPDGTIRAALECPGRKDYQETEDHLIIDVFAYPNHTILAGSPDQHLVAAGSFIVYEHKGNRIYFISNKSGHFVPHYFSLKSMVQGMAALGINENTIISIPDIDIAAVALKLYNSIQIPVVFSTDKNQHLFKKAEKRWHKVYNEIDRSLLEKFSKGEIGELDPKLAEQINQWRNEATYMRSAYHLFSEDHKAPKALKNFVRQFGKLKDVIKHSVIDKIQTESADLLTKIQKYDQTLNTKVVNFSDRPSSLQFFHEATEEIKKLFLQETVSIEEYHKVKKSSRELGVFFELMAVNILGKEEGFFLYRAVSKEFFDVNDIMTEIHDAYIKDQLLGLNPNDHVAIPNKAKETLNRIFSRLRYLPESIHFEIEPNQGFYLINSAKDWYFIHAYMSKHPEDPGTDNYDPRIKAYLVKILTGQEIDKSDEYAIKYLNSVLRTAERAKNGLLLLDKNAELDPMITQYMDALRTVLNNPEDSKGAIQTMLTFLEYKGVPTLSLEKWECVEQEEFDKRFQECMNTIGLLLNDVKPKFDELKRIRENVQMIGDLMSLYRAVGANHQNLPEVYYDTTYDLCQKLLAAIDNNSEKMIFYADELVKLCGN